MTIKELFQSVGILDEAADPIVIPNGQTWEITRWWGSANPNRDTHVALIWDYNTANEVILALTYTTEERNLSRQVIGNGVKKLAIVLVNDSANTERLGAGYEYKVL